MISYLVKSDSHHKDSSIFAYEHFVIQTKNITYIIHYNL